MLATRCTLRYGHCCLARSVASNVLSAKFLHTGLLTLPSSPDALCSTEKLDLARLTSACSLLGSHGRLYVYLIGPWRGASSEVEAFLPTVLARLASIYDLGARLRPDLDVRVLLPEIGSSESAADTVQSAAPELGALIGHPDEKATLASLNATREAAGLPPVEFVELSSDDFPSLSVLAMPDDAMNQRTTTMQRDENAVPLAQYNSVVVGGTFDRLHAGHKLLLSAVGLLARERVSVGVTAEQLLRNKTAGCLVQPCSVRKVSVSSFLESVKPSLKVSAVTISDPVGVAGTDEALDCIVVSEETAAGGHYCNRIRAANGLSSMEVVVVPTIEGGGSNKISSTFLRLSEVGVFKGEEGEWSRRTPPSQPYVIGLTGGIASGKSTVIRALATQAGATVLDVDKVAHKAYDPGTECFAQVVAAFGEEIVGQDGYICRQELGRRVFGERGVHSNDGGARRRQLESIVWPAVVDLLKNILEGLKQEGHSMVVIEAAVLLEAEWDQYVDEVWCLIAPPEEQVTRVMERNSLSRAAAEARIAAQLSNDDRVRRSHVVLLSRERPEDTAASAVAAWRSAERRAIVDCAATPRPVEEVDADPHAPLRERFAALVKSLFRGREACARLEVAYNDSEIANCTRKWWRILHERHCAAGRYYHTLEHLRRFHAAFREYKASRSLESSASCELGIFFHDAIYDATRHDNEARSAALFVDFCADLRRVGRGPNGSGGDSLASSSQSLGLPASLHLEAVCGLILRTAYHMEGPAEGDMAAFLDCDLQVLGSPPSEYHLYAERVRLEYAHVEESQYRTGRAKVLRSFLDDCVNLYFTSRMRQEREAIARANLKAEIARLLK